jgi:hypothetical protein
MLFRLTLGSLLLEQHCHGARGGSARDRFADDAVAVPASLSRAFFSSLFRVLGRVALVAQPDRLPCPCLQDRGSLSLRVASLWVLHNLVYRRTGPAGLAHGNGYGHSHGHRSTRRAVPREVVEKLRAMGLEAKLRTLERDPELDVRERVRDLTEALVLS